MTVISFHGMHKSGSLPNNPKNLLRPGTISAVSTGTDYLYFLGYRISFITMGIAIAVFLLFVSGVVIVVTRLRKHRVPKKASKKGGDAGG